MENAKFSVAMSVYGRDNAAWFDLALGSVIEQTVRPAEIVLIVDGPVSAELDAVIDKYCVRCHETGIRMNLIRFEKNQGLGTALKTAVENASQDLIARMDSDDIAVSDRFERQLAFMEAHSKVHILGGQIEEFIGEPDNPVGKRIVPLTDVELKRYMKRRCPFNHMTVMFRKTAVQAAGGYLDWYWNEDYYLWIRMALKKCTFANLSDTLVHVRVGKDMYRRRGGKQYFKSETDIQKLMLKNRLISVPRFALNVSERLVLQVLLPNNVRGWIFKTLARQK